MPEGGTAPDQIQSAVIDGLLTRRTTITAITALDRGAPCYEATVTYSGACGAVMRVALSRPRASAFGADAYPDLHHKAAALLHSLARNHAVLDGNKRLAWTACRTFLAVNAEWISAPEDERFDFVISVATGAQADVHVIAEQLRARSYREGQT